MNDCFSVYMYEDVGECHNLLVNKSNDDYFAFSLTTEDDKNLGDLKYKKFYIAQYESDTMWFFIYAYRFVDSKTAKSYFKSCAKRESTGDVDCCVSDIPRKYQLTVLDGDRAYFLYSDKSCRKEVDDYLSRAFSIEFECHT